VVHDDGDLRERRRVRRRKPRQRWWRRQRRGNVKKVFWKIGEN